jgi:hypothetical protein
VSGLAGLVDGRGLSIRFWLHVVVVGSFRWWIYDVCFWQLGAVWCPFGIFFLSLLSVIAYRIYACKFYALEFYVRVVRMLKILIILVAVAVSSDARSVGYDAVGRVIWTVQPSGQTTTFDYDANGNVELIGSITPSVDSDSDGIPDYYEIRYSGADSGLDASSDEDADGNDNLREFAFGLDPTTGDGFSITPISLTAEDVSGDSYFTLTYLRPQSGTLHLSYETQICFDLQDGWTSETSELIESVVVDLEEGLEQVTVTFLEPISSNRTFFIRVVASPLL